MTYETDRKTTRPLATDSDRVTRSGGTGGALVQILGIAAIALVAMALLAFGYNTRESATQTAAGGGDLSIQAQQPDQTDYVAPTDQTEPPTTTTAGQGASEGEQRAPAQ